MDEMVEIITVVQPEICVICNKSKLDTAGCIGAPDLIVEILSPGNNKKELKNNMKCIRKAVSGNTGLFIQMNRI